MAALAKMSDDAFAALLEQADVDKKAVELAGVDLQRVRVPEHLRHTLYRAKFSHCDFSNGSFAECDLSCATFHMCGLNFTQFGNANLGMTRFLNCDLREAVLWPCNLADTEFAGVPRIERSHPLQVELSNVPGDLVDMANWTGCKGTGESCRTVHCIAGWVVDTYPAGEMLAEMYGYGTAAALILATYDIPCPDFLDTGAVDSNIRAVEWLRRQGNADYDMRKEPFRIRVVRSGRDGEGWYYDGDERTKRGKHTVNEDMWRMDIQHGNNEFQLQLFAEITSSPFKHRVYVAPRLFIERDNRAQDPDRTRIDYACDSWEIDPAMTLRLLSTWRSNVKEMVKDKLDHVAALPCQPEYVPGI